MQKNIRKRFAPNRSDGLLAAFGIASALAADDEHPPIPQESEIAKTFATETEKLEFIRKIVRERRSSFSLVWAQPIESMRKQGKTPKSSMYFPDTQRHGCFKLYQYDRKKKEFSIVSKCRWNEHGPY